MTNHFTFRTVAVVVVMSALFSIDTWAADFSSRCADANVVRCVSFDSASDLGGTYGNFSGTLPGNGATPVIDTAVKASGNGALKLTVLSNSSAGGSGSYFTNFSSDNSIQFGENAEFFVQWRQRFSAEFLTTIYDDGGGWKQIIIGTGDKSASQLYASCTALETVLQNTYQRGLPQMYNSCTGSASHGPYEPFEEPFGAYDFKLQNARPSPYCLYSQRATGFFPPQGNCIGYYPNEWMTFQVSIKTGPRVSDEWVNSRIKLWVAREGEPSQLALDFPWNLTAGSAAEDQKFGKVWLLNYHTGKSAAQTHPVGYVWYDELIISRAKIADPVGSGSSTPAPPQNLSVN